MRRRVLAMLGVGLWAALSCDTGPRAGDVPIELTSTRTDLGAVLFVARAAEPQTIDTVTAACQGCQAFMVRASASEVRGVLTGQLVDGTVLNLTVSDRKAVEAYTIQLVQVATRAHDVVGSVGTRMVLGGQ